MAAAGDHQVKEALASRAGVARDWLFQHALPLWCEQGFDRSVGCFDEALSQAGTREIRPRRVRVQARQTAVFAQAGRLGWKGPWREMVEAGVAVLLTRALRPDGGAVHLLGADGRPADPRRDLYDLAFVMFGLAHAAMALAPRGDLLAAAEAQIAWIETRWAHPAGGFIEGEVREALPRRQNSHMHMFEALLTLHEASGDARCLARANAIRDLVFTRMVDACTGALREYFTADWAPAPGHEGRIAEPGHMFEWCWLLHRQATLTGEAPVPRADALRRFAETHGVDAARGLVFDEIDIEGQPLTRSSRLWPHTERLRAHCAHYRATGEAASGAQACAAYDMLWPYLQTPRAGLWWDRRTPDGVFVAEAAPASSLYHIAGAVFELMAAAA